MGIRVHAGAVPDQPPPLVRISYTRILTACWNGELPAELLERGDRDQLIYELWKAGWTDAEVAAHTRLSTYTSARIRERLGLSVHVPHWKEHGAA